MCEGKSKPIPLEEYIPVIMEQPINHYQKQMVRELALAAGPLIISIGSIRKQIKDTIRELNTFEMGDVALPKYFNPTSIQKSRGKRKQKRY